MLFIEGTTFSDAQGHQDSVGFFKHPNFLKTLQIKGLAVRDGVYYQKRKHIRVRGRGFPTLTIAWIW